MDQSLPKHVAIVMDGNGRWAKKRMLPKAAGHRAGAKAFKEIIKHSVRRGIRILTAFAFSSENWGRPEEEVHDLIQLFVEVLRNEAATLHKNNIRIRFIGDHSRFTPSLQQEMTELSAATAIYDRLTLVVAMNYGGRWDIVQAAKAVAMKVQSGDMQPEQITTDTFHRHLSTADLPDPDLVIRTSKEYRISNFLLWQSAYAEFFFSEKLWPDFDITAYEKALEAYALRERRFGKV